MLDSINYMLPRYVSYELFCIVLYVSSEIDVRAGSLFSLHSTQICAIVKLLLNSKEL